MPFIGRTIPALMCACCGMPSMQAALACVFTFMHAQVPSLHTPLAADIAITKGSNCSTCKAPTKYTLSSSNRDIMYELKKPFGAAVSKVRLLPSPPPSTDVDGRSKLYRFLVYGCWHDGAEGNFLGFSNLAICSRDQDVVSTEHNTMAFYGHAGTMTDLVVSELSPGNVLVAFGTTAGGIYLARLTVPLAPGSTPEELQVHLSDGPGSDGTQLQPRLRPHAHSVAALDIQAETRNIVSAGPDGIFVLHPDAHGAESCPAPFKQSAGFKCYTAACWADTQQFVTSSQAGGLDVWDVRQGPVPCSSSAKEWGPTGRGAAERGVQGQIFSLAVHPSRPNLCATGGTGGCVALWDLRFTSSPLSYAPPEPGAGAVWDVAFDPLGHWQADAHAHTQSATPSVLYCNDDGILGRTHTLSANEALAAQPNGLFGQAGQPAAQSSVQGGRLGSTTLQYQAGGISSFDVDRGYGQDLVCMTERQSLVYLRRTLPQ